MTGFFIFLAIIFLIAFINIKITIIFKSELKIYISVLFFRFTITPKKVKSGSFSMSERKAVKIRSKLFKKSEKKNLKTAEKKKMKDEDKPKEKWLTPAAILNNLDIIKLFFEKVIKKFGRHIRIKVAKLRIKIATGDAANTAVLYGAACTGANALLSLFATTKQFYRLRNSDIDIKPDFLSEKSEFDLKIRVSLRVWQIFNFAVTALIRVIAIKLRLTGYQRENNPETAKKQPSGNIKT